MRKVFILGAHRSGTSKLAAYFRDVLEFKGYAEGHIFRYLHFLLEGQKDIIDTIPPNAYEINRIGMDFIMAQMVKHLDTIVTAHHGKQRSGADVNYVDKTPGYQMINAAPLLHAHVPEARFIHIHRNGIENVNSNLRLWESRLRKGAFAMWSSSIKSFFEVEAQLGDRLLKLSQRDIAIAPVETHKRIVEFLDLDSQVPDERLIEFFSKGSASSRQKFTADLATRAPTLAEQDWTEQEKEQFAKTCGPWMEKLGYPM